MKHKKTKQTDRENTQTEVTYTHRKETDRENTPTEKKKHIKTRTEKKAHIKNKNRQPKEKCIA